MSCDLFWLELSLLFFSSTTKKSKPTKTMGIFKHPSLEGQSCLVSEGVLYR